MKVWEKSVRWYVSCLSSPLVDGLLSHVHPDLSCLAQCLAHSWSLLNYLAGNVLEQITSGIPCLFYLFASSLQKKCFQKSTKSFSNQNIFIYVSIFLALLCECAMYYGYWKGMPSQIGGMLLLSSSQMVVIHWVPIPFMNRGTGRSC